MGSGFILNKGYRWNKIARWLYYHLPEGEVVIAAKIGIYEMGGDVAHQGQDDDRHQVHREPDARVDQDDQAGGERRDGEPDRGQQVGQDLQHLQDLRDEREQHDLVKGQHLLVDAAEVLCIYTFYVAGQAENMFAADGPMVGALRASFPGVQMGKVSVDRKPFINTIPGILEVSFSAPVKHGMIFFKRLDELTKKQMVVNEDGEDRYIKTVMKDDEGYNVEAYLDRDCGEIRRCTGR